MCVCVLPPASFHKIDPSHSRLCTPFATLVLTLPFARSLFTSLYFSTFNSLVPYFSTSLLFYFSNILIRSSISSLTRFSHHPSVSSFVQSLAPPTLAPTCPRATKQPARAASLVGPKQTCVCITNTDSWVVRAKSLANSNKFLNFNAQRSHQTSSNERLRQDHQHSQKLTQTSSRFGFSCRLTYLKMGAQDWLWYDEKRLVAGAVALHLNHSREQTVGWALWEVFCYLIGTFFCFCFSCCLPLLLLILVLCLAADAAAAALVAASNGYWLKVLVSFLFAKLVAYCDLISL